MYLLLIFYVVLFFSYTLCCNVDFCMDLYCRIVYGLFKGLSTGFCTVLGSPSLRTGAGIVKNRNQYLNFVMIYSLQFI